MDMEKCFAKFDERIIWISCKTTGPSYKEEIVEIVYVITEANLSVS